MKTIIPEPRRRAAGFSIIEVMIVAAVFVLIAVSLYGTLTNLTQLNTSSDTSVGLQLEGQRALNIITRDLRAAGFYRPKTDQSLASYSASIWTANPNTEVHSTWDVPYLWSAEGAPTGVFSSLSHAPAKHTAVFGDEEYGATREMCYVPLSPLVSGSTMTSPHATVSWTAAGLGATSSVVIPIQWQLVSYELQTETGEDFNRLKRITRAVNSSSMSVGAITQTVTLGTYVEAVRFDSAQSDASLALNTIKVTLWMRKPTPSGQIVKAKVSTRVRLRNSL